MRNFLAGKGLYGFLLAGVLFMLIISVSEGVAWTTEQVVPSGSGGTFSEMVLDSAGNAHVVYMWGEYLMYATNASGSWVSEVAASSGRYASIAVDSSGYIHISYSDNRIDSYYEYYELKYVTNVSGLWNIRTIELVQTCYDYYCEVFYGTASSIAVDSSDNVHIGYLSINDDAVKHATNASGFWVRETVATDIYPGSYNDLAIDGSGNLHMSYYSGYPDDALTYATNASGSWVTTTVESNVIDSNCVYECGETSIAIDPSGNAHISYSAITDLKYATNASGSWVVQIVEDMTYDMEHNSIALDSSNDIHIAYYDKANQDLKYATNSSGSWVSETVDSAGLVGKYAAISTDSSGYVYISYYDETNNALKYAKNVLFIPGPDNDGDGYAENEGDCDDTDPEVNPGMTEILFNGKDDDCDPATLDYTWSTMTVAESGDVGQFTSIAADSSGNVHISYYDVTNADLMYITNESGSWIAVTVDSAGDVGKYSSIAVDSLDKVHISYNDATNGDLKYATNASGNWTATLIDEGNVLIGDVDRETSIALDSNNNVHIAYCYNLTSALVYANNSSGNWVINELYSGDSIYITYWSPSIALNSSDNVYIGYVETSRYDFYYYYTTNKTGSWVNDSLPDGNSNIAIDSTDSLHFSSAALALDASDKEHISYGDSTDLIYETNMSGFPVAQTVDSAGDVGSYSSIAIDPLGNVHISYYDATNGDLKYATNAGDVGFSDITATPASKDFGDIAVGSVSSTQIFTISNAGTADLVIGGVYLTGTNPYQFSIQSENCQGRTIAPSGTCTIEASYQPTKTGTMDAEIGVDSNDPDTPDLYIGLSGTGVRGNKCKK